jgi:hypothetical protein
VTLPASRATAARIIRVTSLLLVVCAFFALPSSAASTDQPMRVTLTRAVGTATTTVYGVHVVSEGMPILAVLPDEVRLAELVVNGKVAQQAGRDVTVGLRPFGYGNSALLLAGLTHHDDIQIVESGKAEAPTIASDVRQAVSAFASGLASGVVFGVLVTLVLLQIVAALTNRDPRTSVRTARST